MNNFISLKATDSLKDYRLNFYKLRLYYLISYISVHICKSDKILSNFCWNILLYLFLLHCHCSIQKSYSKSARDILELYYFCTHTTYLKVYIENMRMYDLLDLGPMFEYLLSFVFHKCSWLYLALRQNS